MCRAQRILKFDHGRLETSRLQVSRDCNIRIIPIVVYSHSVMRIRLDWQSVTPFDGSESARPAVAAEHRFSEEQMRTLDYQTFVQRFDPRSSPPPQVRREMGALKIMLGGFEQEPLAACGNEHARAFIQALHRDWPYGFFYLTAHDESLKMFAFSLLPSVTVHKRAGHKITVTGYRRRDLLHLIGDAVLELEKSCTYAGLSFEEYRARSRILLSYFGFLK